MGGIMTEWTLLSNHGLTLLSLADKPQATTREIANDLGVTERTVQRIVSDLDSADYIDKEKVGRQNRYKVNREKRLRHPVSRDKTIGNLLAELVT
jgi:DNA-binding MarR family transcriptional regulator